MAWLAIRPPSSSAVSIRRLLGFAVFAAVAPSLTGQTINQKPNRTYPRFIEQQRFDRPGIAPLSAIDQARQAAERLRRLAADAGVSEPIRDLCDGNAKLAARWAELAESDAVLIRRLNRSCEDLERLRLERAGIESKLERFGLTPTIGLLLRQKKEQLNVGQTGDSVAAYTASRLSECRQTLLELELISPDGSDPAGQAAVLLADVPKTKLIGPSVAISRNEPTRQTAERLLRERSQWIGQLRKTYDDYQQRLAELESVAATRRTDAAQFRRLIDRNVIWIRSGDPVNLEDVRMLRGGVAALFDPRRSADFGPALQRKLKYQPLLAIGLLLAVAVTLAMRWIAKRRITAIATGKSLRHASDRARRAAAGGWTTLVAVGIPLTLWMLSFWLGSGVVSESMLHGSAAFAAAGLVAALIEFPRQLLRDGGMADKHTDLDLPRRSRAFKYLTLIGLLLVVFAYTITAMGRVDRGVWHDSIARFGMIFCLILVAVTMHRSLRPKGGFLEAVIAWLGGTVIFRLRGLIYVAGITFPLAMIALVALGYQFTASVLIARMIVTLVVAMAALTIWPGVKFASAWAWQRLTGSAPPPVEYDEFGPIERPAEVGVLGEHFLELKHQLAFLLQVALIVVGIVGAVGLWIDVFPGVRMGNPTLWTVADSAGEGTPVTALHVLIAAATLFVAFQVAKLLPALLDALVLQRVSFDEGMEHFSLVLGRCLLFGVGCLIACQLIGLRWQTVQWLAVGLAIGLGFGLQDMVRNLCGGIVVLFEKPARLGDLISVGEVTGRVAMQRLRTTIVTADDGREVTIPNQNFVTDDVVHWGGAGRVSGISLDFAVTRDQRPADICRNLRELMIEQPGVLIRPAPRATLVCVGKKSQRIEVRVWTEQSAGLDQLRDRLLKLAQEDLRDRRILTPQQPRRQRAA